MEQFFLVGWSALLTAARENATKTEIAQLVEHFDTRFNRLEIKIDGLISKG